MTQEARVAVIGGGWAGCAAAVTLADAGVRVELFETAPVLGGRARRVLRAGLPLDNGQHLLLGAYERTLALLELVHGASGCARGSHARSAGHRAARRNATGRPHAGPRQRRRLARIADGTAERARTGLARAHRQHRLDAQAEAHRLRAAALRNGRADAGTSAAARGAGPVGAAVPGGAQHAARQPHRRRSSPMC